MSTQKSRKPKKISVASGHNERKLSVLLSVFDTFKTAGEAAKETLSEGVNFKTHRRCVQISMSRYRHHFTHPYLIHENLKKARAGGKVAYKCTKKGKKMACELFYRKKKGYSLKWDRHYYVSCFTSCEKCKFNPKHIEGDEFPARRLPEFLSILPSPEDFSVLTPPRG